MTVPGPPLDRRPLDLDKYNQRTKGGPCFVCATVNRRPGHEHEIVHEDEQTVAFLNKWPTLWGYTLVAPKRHAERLVADMTMDEYLAVQAVVYRIAAAVSAVVATERVYVLSLGSQEGNAHVHWHVAPLPPGVPYDQQQFHALMAENGVLSPTAEQSAQLAIAIRGQLAVTS